MNDNFKIVGARELTDEELMSIQGGSFWSTIKHVAHAVTHPAETLDKLENWVRDQFSKFDPKTPW